ncbi:ImmA/IrrE family metallo-endopeptidase [Corallococcus exiguus]|uniref:ImmA/IrrE family metallo-endopeptidase n=1 Tax=Corallococcus exiguus TaxID=83462 RepID=UPI001494BCFE|nr:ImmA/IrrE family metallo-endopeptidase [Corallococcus exiguus]NPD27394.1 ImmA/IrrE family metallo-endopeptidase [Corallococcus exiguus]
MRLHAVRSEAEKLARNHGVVSAPVDVKKIARALKIKLVDEHLDPDVSGLLVTDTSGTRICVNASHHSNRQRFTIAHELGHFVLGHHFANRGRVHVDRRMFVSARSSRSSEGVDLNEIEANQFASALLIPEWLLDKEFQTLNLQEPLADADVELLASHFEVSEHAMSIRLSKLGYF